jgi:hypothetical protein
MLLSVTGHRRLVDSRLLSEAHRSESKESGENNSRMKYRRHHRSLFLLDVQVLYRKTKMIEVAYWSFSVFTMILRYGAHCYLQVGLGLSFSQEGGIAVMQAGKSRSGF